MTIIGFARSVVRDAEHCLIDGANPTNPTHLTRARAADHDQMNFTKAHRIATATVSGTMTLSTPVQRNVRFFTIVASMASTPRVRFDLSSLA